MAKVENVNCHFAGFGKEVVVVQKRYVQDITSYCANDSNMLRFILENGSGGDENNFKVLAIFKTKKLHETKAQ